MIAMLLGCGGFGFATEIAVSPAMKADFEVRLRAALEKTEPTAWHELRFWGGVDAAQRKEAEAHEFLLQSWESLRELRTHLEIQYGEPGTDLTKERVAGGKRYRPNLPVVLQARLHHTRGASGKPGFVAGDTVLALGIHDGKLYAPAALVEDLHWTGAPDHGFLVMVRPSDATDDFSCNLEIEYNASGIDLVDKMTVRRQVSRSGSALMSSGGGSANFAAQKVKRIVVREVNGSGTLSGSMIDGPELPNHTSVTILPKQVAAGKSPIPVVLWPTDGAAK